MQNKNKNLKEKSNVSRVDINIGDILVSRRKKKRLSIDDVSNNINLSNDIIENLESSNFSNIGTSVYVRGYLSLYAKFLGLDVAKVINLYDAEHADNTNNFKATANKIKSNVKKEKKRYSKTLSLLITLLLLIGLLYFYYRIETLLFNKRQEITKMAVEDEVKNEPTTAKMDFIDKNLSVDILVNNALQGSPIDNNELIDEIDLNKIDLESLSEDLSDDTIYDNNLSKKAESSEDQKDLVINDRDEDQKESVINDRDNVTLKITFNKNCWIKLSDATGKVLAMGIYSPRRALDINGKPPFLLKTARDHAFDLISFNDKNVKLKDYHIENFYYKIK